MQSVQTMILELSQISTVQCRRKENKADFTFTSTDYRQAMVGNILVFILSYYTSSCSPIWPQYAETCNSCTTPNVFECKEVHLKEYQVWLHVLLHVHYSSIHSVHRAYIKVLHGFLEICFNFMSINNRIVINNKAIFMWTCLFALCTAAAVLHLLQILLKAALRLAVDLQSGTRTIVASWSSKRWRWCLSSSWIQDSWTTSSTAKTATWCPCPQDKTRGKAG